MNRRVSGYQVIVSISLTLLANFAFAQPPYIDGNLLVIPAVEIGGEKYRVEFVVDAATNPVSLNLHYAEPVENVSSYQASNMVGPTLTIPKLRCAGLAMS